MISSSDSAKIAQEGAPAARSDLANLEAVSSVPSPGDESDSLLISSAVLGNKKKEKEENEEQKSNVQGEGELVFIAHKIEDVEVDPSLVQQAREEINAGIFITIPGENKATT